MVFKEVRSSPESLQIGTVAQGLATLPASRSNRFTFLQDTHYTTVSLRYTPFCLRHPEIAQHHARRQPAHGVTPKRHWKSTTPVHHPLPFASRDFYGLSPPRQMYIVVLQNSYDKYAHAQAERTDHNPKTDGTKCHTGVYTS